jgi:F0F1-type ATP synthase gamma subunit
MAGRDFPTDPDSEREFEAQRKELLLGQECLAALSETERNWLRYLYDHQPWVAQSLQTLYNFSEEREKLVQELLRDHLEVIIEQEIQNYLKAEFGNDPEIFRGLNRFADMSEGREQIAKACLAQRTNLSVYVSHERPELFVNLYKFLETLKGLEPFVASERFKVIVEGLPNNMQFNPLDEIVRFLNKLANQMGKRATKEAFLEISKKFSKDKERKNMMNRLRRALLILLW